MEPDASLVAAAATSPQTEPNSHTIAASADTEDQSGDEDDEPGSTDSSARFQPGVVTTYLLHDGTSVVRVRDHVRWCARPSGTASPDAGQSAKQNLPTLQKPGDVPSALASGATANSDSPVVPERIRWRGHLLVFAPGSYQLHVYAAGRVGLRVRGQKLLAQSSDAPRWLAAASVELEYGYHSFELSYEPRGPAPLCELYWQGPQFDIEPLMPRWLFHDVSQLPTAALRWPDDRLLVAAAGCNRCHKLPGIAETLPGPALDKLPGNIATDWLIDWLVTGQHGHALGRDAARARTSPPTSPGAAQPPKRATDAPPQPTTPPGDSTSGAPMARGPSRAVQPGGATEDGRPVPRFELSPQQARAIIAYLLAPSSATTPHRETSHLDSSGRTNHPHGESPAGSSGPPSSQRQQHRATDKPADNDAVARGRRLFFTAGCLACHRLGAVGSHDPLAGPNLSHIGAKRPRAFFVQWLKDPGLFNADHRMPSYGSPVLDDRQRNDLAAFLATLGRSAKPHARTAVKGGSQLAPRTGRSDPSSRNERTPNRAAEGDPGSQMLQATINRSLVDQGRRLTRQFRCGNCHRLPSSSSERHAPARLVEWPQHSLDWNVACLGRGPHRPQQPRYHLAPQQAATIRRVVEACRTATAAARRFLSEHSRGQTLLKLQRCTSCHSRHHAAGIAQHLPELLALHPDLGAEISVMTPPSLSGVGDKLPSAELEEAVQGRYPPLRPWLAARMPRFVHLNASDRRAIRDELIAADRMAPTPAAAKGTKRPATAALRVAGARLVTTGGFGCTSCHAIGRSKPEKVEPKAHGTDLSMLGRRIRRPWFDRWVRNPARIVPRMEMPAIRVPIRGVLDERLDTQLSAVWHVLNQPGFDPPKPDPIRVVRSTNNPEAKEIAHVLTDVIEVGEQTFLQPLLIGLTNRNNVLFDLDSFRLAGWWLGDTAQQRTRGKTWYWEPGGPAVLSMPGTTPDLLVISPAGDRYRPQRVGQFISQFDRFEKVQQGRGVRFSTPLFLGRTDDNPAPVSKRHGLPIHVVQTITPIVSAVGDSSQSDRARTAPPHGFQRHISIHGVPAGWTVHWRVLSATGAPSHWHVQRNQLAYVSPTTNCQVTHMPTEQQRLLAAEDGVWLQAQATEQPLVASFAYTTRLPIDRFPQAPPPRPVRKPHRVDVVPGMTGIRLPLTDEPMPTGLAWCPDGTLVFSSLKGRVWLARDTDGDGLEDEAWPTSDELAAPYGVATGSHWIDVINKYALLRLYDNDGDGLAERVETLASGWGHTDDYHDWAVGLPRDAAGNYYVALPCQQDDRSPAAARWRGTVVRLSPNAGSDGRPRYRVEPIAAGLRFPMGLALRYDGTVLATDNQGNYTPFNELNHILPGRRYGFINQLERRPGFHPPFQPPAINIPHPWTRSVNGLCFLPSAAPPASHQGSEPRQADYGPFSGHLIGCEYTTRQLIRMSLQTIDGTLQGAVYPFTRPVEKLSENLLGPVVCAVSPSGALYVGNMRDSAWGGGTNRGNIVRFVPTGRWPLGIAEIRARYDGFVIDFTAAVDRHAAADPHNYKIASFRRIPTPAYGSPDVDRRDESILQLDVAPDARRVTVHLGTLRKGFVYEFHLAAIGPGETSFWPAEAYYTLNAIPQPPRGRR